MLADFLAGEPNKSVLLGVTSGKEVGTAVTTAAKGDAAKWNTTAPPSNASSPGTSPTPSDGLVRGSGSPVHVRLFENDGGVYGGWVVPQFYDPMISKVCAWAPTREQAIARLHRALGEYTVHGIAVNLRYLRAVLEHPAFAAGEIDTHFIDRHLPAPARTAPQPRDRAAATARSRHPRAPQPLQAA